MNIWLIKKIIRASVGVRAGFLKITNQLTLTLALFRFEDKLLFYGF
jgi:hypothetical protein